ncbi:MAG: DUF4268 domain-containing protein, partial [Actinobacteria bacterium]|nr:DUF4268 domain-containing protein [Actinomycetota bacterium]
AQEKDVGPFRADLLCKSTLDGSWVLVENQLASTDHTHLGQLLTYAAGLEAVTIVWIAAAFTEEHRAALDWLNEITDERFRFFGLEVELWRIGASATAPKFSVISKPNDWSATVQAAARDATRLTEHQRLQLEFWTEYRAYMAQHSDIQCSKPGPQNWMSHPIVRSGIQLSSVISAWSSQTATWDPEIRVELVTYDTHSKAYFALLEAQKSEIERELGRELTWHNPDNARQCRIYTRRSLDFTDRDRWQECFAWLRTNLEDFHRVFSPHVKQLDPSNAKRPVAEAGDTRA